MRDGLRNLLSHRRMQGERDGTREALESLREPLERHPEAHPGNERKSLARRNSFPSVLATPEHPEDTRKAALTRAFAEMFDLSDRFNTETEET